MAKIKTFKQWEKSGLELTEYLNPCDQVDEEIVHHMETVVPPQYSQNGLMQDGEPERMVDGVYFYSTFSKVDGKYYYLGILPEFMQ